MKHQLLIVAALTGLTLAGPLQARQAPSPAQEEGPYQRKIRLECEEQLRSQGKEINQQNMDECYRQPTLRESGSAQASDDKPLDLTPAVPHGQGPNYWDMIQDDCKQQLREQGKQVNLKNMRACLDEDTLRGGVSGGNNEAGDVNQAKEDDTDNPVW